MGKNCFRLISVSLVIGLLALMFSGDIIALGQGAYPSEWWNYDWRYRIPIRIEEKSGNNLTDYQVLITIDTASLIEAGKMQPNCSDIRFIDSANNELPYWIESGENTRDTSIWIKMPKISANKTTTIYMYYGNPAVNIASNAESVFDFFDDFIGTELNSGKWAWQTVWWKIDSSESQPGNGYVRVFNSIASVVAPKNNQPYPWEISSTQLSSTSTFAPPLILEIRASAPNWGGYGGAGWYRSCHAALSDENISIAGPCNSVQVFGANEWRYGPEVANKTGGTSGSNYDGTPTDFHVYKVIWSVSFAEFYKDGKYHEKLTEHVPNVSLSISFCASNWAGTRDYPDGRIDVDWIRIRKYAPIEPTYSLGHEEAFLNFSIPWETKTYHVTVMSNSTVEAFSFSQPAMQVRFNVSGLSGTVGYCNVSIPKSLLKGEPWAVKINGVDWSFISSENATYSFIYFTYMHASTLQVIVQGTWAIPEYTSIVMLPIFFTLITLPLIYIRKKRHSKQHHKLLHLS